jgi:hypothetical protein
MKDAYAQGSPSHMACRWCKQSKRPIESSRDIPVRLADGTEEYARSSVLICPNCDTVQLGVK